MSHERGLRDFHEARYRKNFEPPCPESNPRTRFLVKTTTANFPQLKFQDSLLPFQIVGVGAFLSLTLWFIELNMKTMNRNK